MPCIQQGDIDTLLEYSNLWGNMADKYANLTFYPNLPLEVLQRNKLLETNIVPEHMLERENY